jgi:hypothetical protein
VCHNASRTVPARKLKSSCAAYGWMAQIWRLLQITLMVRVRTNEIEESLLGALALERDARRVRPLLRARKRGSPRPSAAPHQFGILSCVASSAGKLAARSPGADRVVAVRPVSAATHYFTGA